MFSLPFTCFRQKLTYRLTLYSESHFLLYMGKVDFSQGKNEGSKLYFWENNLRVSYRMHWMLRRQSQLEARTWVSPGESESHSVMSDSLRPHGLYSPWNSLGQNTEVGSLSLLKGIFPTQRSNCIADGFFTNWATREAPKPQWWQPNWRKRLQAALRRQKGLDEDLDIMGKLHILAEPYLPCA